MDDAASRGWWPTAERERRWTPTLQLQSVRDARSADSFPPPTASSHPGVPFSGELLVDDRDPSRIVVPGGQSDWWTVWLDRPVGNRAGRSGKFRSCLRKSLPLGSVVFVGSSPELTQGRPSPFSTGRSPFSIQSIKASSARRISPSVTLTCPSRSTAQRIGSSASHRLSALAAQLR